MSHEFTPLDVQTWLEWAGAKMLVMSVGRVKPAGYRTYWPDTPPDAEVAYGSKYRDVEISLPKPSADQIPYIDEILALVVVIPDDVRRRVVSCRALVRPGSGTPVYGWKRLSKVIRTSPYHVKTMHQRGLREICELTPEPKMRRIASFINS